MSKLETKAANRLLLYAMLLAASYTLTRTAGDSLFLSRIGSESLAFVFFISSVASAVLATFWFALTRRISTSVSIKISGAVSFALTLAAWLALPYLHHSVGLLAAIYLLTELKGCVNTINVVSATNEVLGGHSSRHAWARIGLGAPFAGVVVGVLVGIEAGQFDIGTWLLLSALLDLVAVLPLLKVKSLVVPKLLRVRQRGSMHDFINEKTERISKYVCSKRFRFWIGVLFATKMIVLTIVSFKWKIGVNQFFEGDEKALARYFAIFYAGAGVLTLLIQMGVTGRLLSKRKWWVPILLMPVSLAVLCTAMVIGSGALFLLVAVTLAKSLEIWRRSVHDTTLSLMYTKIERAKRRTAIAMNAAVVKPIAEVSASLILLVGTTYWHNTAMFGALFLWLTATVCLLRLVGSVSNRTRRSSSKPPSQSNAMESDVDQRRVRGWGSGLLDQ